MTNASRLSSVELFTGAGGLALGVAAAGFRHRLLLEYNKDACKTLRANHAVFGGDACEIFEGDVKAYDFSSISEIDLLAAGAPCQPFSIAGKHRADQDERNLFPHVFRAQRELRPKAVVVENVKGLLRASLAEFVEYIELQLAHPTVLPIDPFDPDGWLRHLPKLRDAHTVRDDTEFQYTVSKALLNAADFGAPQRRERVFFVAIRDDVGASWLPPRPTHSRAALQLAISGTGQYWKKHGLAEKFERNPLLLGKWLREAGDTEPWRTVRDALEGLPTPIAGREAPDYANHIGQPGARSYAGHTGSPVDQPAKTLKAGVHGVPGGENMLRNPNGSVRYFTAREAARIQTFPDSYIFSGSWGESLRQIGNAVPVALARAIARSVHECLSRPISANRALQSSRRPTEVRNRVPVQQVLPLVAR
jgi:DNA (cytosine-5)-methyltransferase 1